MKKLFFVFLLLLFFISIYSQERRLALVIGNGNYLNSTLSNPENDARSMEKSLSSIGFEVLKYENLGQKEMSKAIDEFGNKLQDYDVGLFFYAGHGIQSKGFNYLIPVDAKLVTESDVEYNCVRADRALGKMEDAKSNVNIIILDACRDNPFERSWTRAAKGRGLATMSAPVGSILGFATSPGSTASDGYGENGLYTSGLLTYLNEPGITAIQMLQKVTAYVIKNSDGQQLPWVSTSLTADFFLVPGSGKTDFSIDKLERNEIQSPFKNKTDESDEEISIAILPFSNLTGEAEQDYIVRGQHEALYTELCKLSQFKPIRIVGGRTASALSNTQMTIPEIARIINVDFLVEASVLTYADSVILQLRLIQAYPEEKPIFATTYTSDFRNILKLHNNIAGQIAQHIDQELTPDNLVRLPEVYEVNPEAYKAYLRGMYQLNLLTTESMERGLEYLHEAVRIDPADPFAYAGLALGYLELAHSPFDPGDALSKAEAAVKRAISIDSTLTEVYAALGEVYLYKTWEFEKAVSCFKKALKLNPNLAITHYHYSWALYLFGRMEDAIQEHKLAQKYDPFNPLHTAWLAALYCFDDKYEDALRESFDADEIQKNYPATYYSLGMTYLKMGKIDEAIEAHKRLVEIRPSWTWSLGYTYAKTGHRKKAEEILLELEKADATPWTAFGLVVMYSALGDYDNAFKWLAYKPHHAFTAWVAVMPEFNSLHDDPRFDEFVNMLNLPK